MTPERWARIKAVFASVQERPENERESYLDQACGSDDALREDIRNMLSAGRAGILEGPMPAILNGPGGGALAADSEIGHYRVERELGAGGMGTVYRAYDTQLRRPVALKVLPSDFQADPERRERLLREARAASAINHPNVVGIYEIGSDASLDFIAMEFVEGESLDKVIPAEGLPLPQALDYGEQIAAGLTKADPGHAGLHVAGADRGEAVRAAIRRLLVRRRVVRDGYRPASFRRSISDRGPRRDLVRGTVADRLAA